MIKSYNNIINDFVKDCKDLIINLKTFKKSIKQIVPIKEQELMFQKSFTDFLVKYETVNSKTAIDIGITKASEMNVTLLTGDQKKEEMKEKMDKIVKFNA